MPLYEGFCGPSNPGQSVIADGERCVNFYQETVQSEFAPARSVLCPTPGRRPLLTVPDVNCHGVFSMGGRSFAVVGAGLYEFYEDWTYTKRGTVAQDSNPATISYNGVSGGQLLITSGGNVYCYVLATNTLSTVLTGGYIQGGMIDARFLAFNPTLGRVRMSALNDGTTWDASLYFGRTLAPDPWVAMFVSPPEIWMIGEQSGECWYDSGAFPQPFAPINGAFFPIGTSASFSVGRAGESIMWLTRTPQGSGQVVAASGYAPRVVSNYAVDTEIATYARQGTLGDTLLFAYEDQGHPFACFSFRIGRNTWVQDQSTGLWHERRTWNGATAAWDEWAPSAYGYCFNRHIVGDRKTGILAELDPSYGTEADGSTIRRVRIPPALWAAAPKRLVVDRLQIMIEPGLGTETGQGSDPEVMLRCSSNAKTWGNERTAKAGKQGEFGRRVIFSRCGSSELVWVPEVSVSDPIPWRISGAFVEGSGIQGGA